MAVMATISQVSAQTSAGQPKLPPAEVPYNCRCIVTLDPQFKLAAEGNDTAQKASGFISPNTVEGVVIRMDSEWLVLKDGTFENWIPMAKVLLVRASR